MIRTCSLFLLLLVSSSSTNAVVYYDFVDDSSLILGTLGFDEARGASGISGWGATNSPYIVESFSWFDDTSGIASGTGLWGLGLFLPGAVYSNDGQTIDGGRINIDTRNYQTGDPANNFAPLAYDIFPNLVLRTTNRSANSEWWFGRWEVRSVPDTGSSIAFLAVALSGIAFSRRMINRHRVSVSRE